MTYRIPNSPKTNFATEPRSLPSGHNAPMESFFGTLKTECLHHFKFKTRDQARQVVFDYIEVFYNRIRRHATIQNQVPADYAQAFYKNELQIAA